MFGKTVTVFNFYKPKGVWYPTVIEGVELQVERASELSSSGSHDGADSVTLLIQSQKDKSILSTAGRKGYLGPKAYAQCEKPADHFTFSPSGDFFYEGAWPSLEPVVDDEFDSGFYHEANQNYDGVYAVKNIAFLELIPHFEVGGM